MRGCYDTLKFKIDKIVFILKSFDRSSYMLQIFSISGAKTLLQWQRQHMKSLNRLRILKVLLSYVQQIVFSSHFC